MGEDYHSVRISSGDKALCEITYLYNYIHIEPRTPQGNKSKGFQNMNDEAVLGCKPLFDGEHKFEKGESLYSVSRETDKKREDGKADVRRESRRLKRGEMVY